MLATVAGETFTKLPARNADNQLIEEEKRPAGSVLLEGIDNAAAAPIDEMFNHCPICSQEKVAKERAVAAAAKTEMILTIRALVENFRKDTDTKLAKLASLIETQLKPILAMTSAVAVERAELTTRLVAFENELKDAFGIKDEIDPNVASGAMFMETIDGDAWGMNLNDEPAPGTDKAFDALTDKLGNALDENDPDEVLGGVAARQEVRDVQKSVEDEARDNRSYPRPWTV